MSKNILVVSVAILLCLLVCPVSFANDWYLGFESGPCVPTEKFDEIMDDDITYGLSVDYVPRNHLGVRVAYNHSEFEYDSGMFSSKPLEFESLGVWAIMDYTAMSYFRFYCLIGPTYYYVKHDQGLYWGDDSQDIGWSGGGGFEFYPVPGWGIRAQAIYYSAEIGDGDPRSSWVSTTLGMSFKF